MSRPGQVTNLLLRNYKEVPNLAFGDLFELIEQQSLDADLVVGVEDIDNQVQVAKGYRLSGQESSISLLLEPEEATRFGVAYQAASIALQAVDCTSLVDFIKGWRDSPESDYEVASQEYNPHFPLYEGISEGNAYDITSSGLVAHTMMGLRREKFLSKLGPGPLAVMSADDMLRLYPGQLQEVNQRLYTPSADFLFS